MKRVVAIAAVAVILLAPPALADSLGSAVGGTAGNQSNMAGGLYQTAPSVLTNGQQAGLRLDANGNLLTSDGGGPVTAGTATTTAAPTYVNGTTNPLSTDIHGGARVLIQDSSGAPLDYTVPSPVTLNPSATVGWTTSSCTVACASVAVTGAHSAGSIIFSATVTGWLLVYDATSCAANGTVTPKKAVAYTTANTTTSLSWADTPMVNSSGIAACFSTTGPYTATSSTTAFISLDYK